jgi:hypothetical protein
MYSSVHGPIELGDVCMQDREKWPALRTPLQGAAGFGARHRRSFTGGIAYGMPLKLMTAPSLLFTPESFPAVVFTSVVLCAIVMGAS